MTHLDLDSAAVGRLLVSPAMFGLVDRVAHDAMGVAVALSPDAPPYGAGYISSFEVSLRADNVTVRPGRRAVARLENTSDYAAAVEWGWDTAHNQWGDHPGYHVLARTKEWVEAL